MMEHARRSLRPVPVSQLMASGPSPSQDQLLHGALFLADELAVRLAHRYKELSNLPYGLGDMKAVKEVRGWYRQSFQELLDFQEMAQSENSAHLSSGFLSRLFGLETDIQQTLPRSSRPNNGRNNTIPTPTQYYTATPAHHPAARQLNTHFQALLHKLITRHAPILLTLSSSIRSLPQTHPHLPPHHPDVQQFVDRVHRTRIAMRVLIAHHLQLHQRPVKNHIGIICTKTNVLDIAQDACEDATTICEQAYGLAPPIHINVSPDTDMQILTGELVYIPSHMHHILFELLKNAMRATIEKHLPQLQQRIQNPEDMLSHLPPVTITLSHTPTHLEIRITDHGSGIPSKLLPHVFNYAYTTAPRPALPTRDNLCHETHETKQAPMAGFGYGLPLSRVYANAFGGTLDVRSEEGKGTEVLFGVTRGWDGGGETFF
ncbi:hypothetical protein HDU85_007734 [Gaertneriomyces sp. JEL0708]|nr:hypothetical protein HDU85_007734 [Gaertneriomyces sp. JEL0708]